MDLLPRPKNNQFAYTTSHMLVGKTVDTLLSSFIDDLLFVTSGDLTALRRVAFNLAASKRLGWPDITLFHTAVPTADNSIILHLERAGIVKLTDSSPGKARVMTIASESAISDDYSLAHVPPRVGTVYMKVNGVKKTIKDGKQELTNINRLTATYQYSYLPSWSTEYVPISADTVTYDRIFINNVNTYGRFIAPFQSLSCIDRATMLIDGQPTCECDYSAMHPTILYAQERQRPPADIYRVPKMPAGARPYVKLALLISINAKDYDSAYSALSTRIPADMDAARLLHGVRRANPGIALHFWSNAGIRLMNTESRIAEMVMSRCLEAGVPVLGIHDGFICRRSDADKVRRVMKVAFNEITRYTGEVGTSVK